MVPVSSAFVLRIVVQVQVPRGLKHARLFRSSSRLVAAAREQTATRSSSRVLDIEDQDSHATSLETLKTATRESSCVRAFLCGFSASLGDGGGFAALGPCEGRNQNAGITSVLAPRASRVDDRAREKACGFFRFVTTLNATPRALSATQNRGRLYFLSKSCEVWP